MDATGAIEVRYENELIGTGLARDFDPIVRQVAAELTAWVNQARAATNRSSMFDRGAYAVPDNPYEQMKYARKAVATDDVVGGIAEITEGLAFDGVKWESAEPDEADVFNQMAAEQNLDAVVRQMYREEFTYDQVVLGFWWTQGKFAVRGKTPNGNKRKREFTAWYPRAITSLDATKVVPVGMLQFGQERLAWRATDEEMSQYQAVLNGNISDQVMERFYSGMYVPSDPVEISDLTAIHVDISRLILLDDQLVRRHCSTKQDFARFPDIRLRRTFKYLDLKQQLMEADRVMLIGAANYILLVRKGDKDDPAYPEELANLRENFNYVAKLPVIFSDHRLAIDIIMPKQDNILDGKKYAVVDNRIAQTTLGMFGTIGASDGNRADTTLTQARLVARNLENKRHMIRRFLEKEIAKAVVEHPKNVGVFSDEPNLTFVPGHVQLDEDTGFAQAIINLRTMNELSRESVLEYFGFDQTVEAMRRSIEEATGLDATFQSRVPFSSPEGAGGANGANGAANGANGGQQAGQSGPGKKTPPANARSQGAGGVPAGYGDVPASQGVNGSRGGRPVGGGQPSKNPTKGPARTARGTTKPAPKGS